MTGTDTAKELIISEKGGRVVGAPRVRSMAPENKCLVFSHKSLRIYSDLCSSHSSGGVPNATAVTAVGDVLNVTAVTAVGVC